MPIPKLELFCNFFAENCMKMKEFGPPDSSASLVHPLDLPMVCESFCPQEDRGSLHDITSCLAACSLEGVSVSGPISLPAIP